jgi:divalent metal cation (Fe/Co/Zn/Cd) transporter
VDVVVKVAPELPTSEAHQIADKIESALESQFGVTDISINIEPGGLTGSRTGTAVRRT